MENFDLADIAAGIMDTDMKSRGFTVSPTQQFPLDEAVDITDVEISKDMVDALIGNGGPVEVQVNESTKEEEVANNDHLRDELSEMVTKFTNLLGEARTLLTEMTTCGMIGTNMGGPAEDPFKKEEEDKKKKKKKKTEEVDEGSMGSSHLRRKIKASFKKERQAKDSGSRSEYSDAAKEHGINTHKSMYKHSDSVGRDESKPNQERIDHKVVNNNRRKNRTTKRISAFHLRDKKGNANKNESVEDIVERLLKG